jgi:peptidyl-prolyl cis-trans isomerase B (cyclophilin B)
MEGYEFVQKVEDVPKNPGDKPAKTVKIVKAGEIELSAKEKEEGIHVEL